MKINIHTRERANMLPTKYWATLINVLVVSLALLLLQPSGAAAGTVTFNDLTETFSISLVGFGTRASSAVGAGESGSVTILPPSPGATVTCVGSNCPGGTGIGGDRNILEPNTTSRTVSDTLKFLVAGPGGAGSDVLHITFVSDPSETGLTGLAPGSSIPGVSLSDITENNSVQTGATVTWSDGTVDTINFASDVEAVVPEPSALLLLGSGLLGIALWSGRRLRRHVKG